MLPRSTEHPAEARNHRSSMMPQEQFPWSQSSVGVGRVLDEGINSGEPAMEGNLPLSSPPIIPWGQLDSLT